MSGADAPSSGDPGTSPPAPELEREPVVLPSSFIAPHRMPVHVDAVAVPDDHGSGWVLARIETVHGSHVAFLAPDVALAFAAKLEEQATRARLLV